MLQAVTLKEAVIAVFSYKVHMWPNYILTANYTHTAVIVLHYIMPYKAM